MFFRLLKIDMQRHAMIHFTGHLCEKSAGYEGIPYTYIQSFYSWFVVNLEETYA